MRSTTILNILADGQFHSGAHLGEMLGLSRTAVWKQVNKLERELQLRIHSVRGKGYRLSTPLELLSEPAIRELMTPVAAERFPVVDIELKTESTNQLAKARGAGAHPYVCLAEMQSAGRGRRGRDWVSPFGKNIYMSLCWTFEEGVGVQQGLSLCVGIALARVVRRLGLAEAGLKWPNDLLYRNHKLAGILLEAVGELAGAMTVIIGIGINVDMDPQEGADIGQRWTAFNREGGARVNRNVLAAGVLNELGVVLPAFQQSGFGGFRQEWQDYDVLFNKQVALTGINNEVEGTARGVSPTGALIIETGAGRSYHEAGEVSVRERS